MAAVRFIIRACASCIWEQRAVFEKNPCCFRPYRVFDHYILAFNSLLLFIDFDNYSGLRKKKKKHKKQNKKKTKPPNSFFLLAEDNVLAHPLSEGEAVGVMGWFHTRF